MNTAAKIPNMAGSRMTANELNSIGNGVTSDTNIELGNIESSITYQKELISQLTSKLHSIIDHSPTVAKDKAGSPLKTRKSELSQKLQTYANVISENNTFLSELIEGIDL